jgi:hypothetical protein
MRLWLLILVSLPSFAACTATVTAPTAASTQSGLVNWTRTTSGCPTGFTTQWVLDDFYTTDLLVTASNGTLANFNTGLMNDGPFNVKVILWDATGAKLATSADIAFKIENFGIVVTATCSSTTSGSVACNSVPTVGGTLTVGVSTNLGSVHDIQNYVYAIDGNQFGGAGDPGGSISAVVDTTKYLNGIHLISINAQCQSTSTNCGTINQINIGDINRMFLGFTVDVENGTAVRDVQPKIQDVVLTVGQTYPLDAVLSNTDGTTSNSTFALTMQHACLVADPQQTQLPFKCASGNVYPGTSLEGTPYISLSSSSLASGTPVTMTGLAQGQTFVTITDTGGSGKARYITVLVKDIPAVRHFGTCGSIYSSYTAGGGCPSMFRSGLFNTDFTDPSIQPDVLLAGWTTAENGFWLDPGNNGGTPYPSFAAWNAQWTASFLNPIKKMMAALPGTCLVLIGAGLNSQPQTMIEVQLGPSASWSPTPLAYALSQLKPFTCGAEQRDEAQNGLLTFNPNFSLKFPDGSVSKIVVKSGVAMAYPPTTTGSYPADPIYGANFRWGSANGVLVQNASTSGFNGLSTPRCLYHALWNTIIEAASTNLAGFKTIASVTTGNPTVITTNGNLQINGLFPQDSTINIYGIAGTLGAALNGLGIYPNSIVGATITVPINTTGLSGSLSGATVTPGACADPNTKAGVEDTFTFSTSAADGTYTSGSNPTLEMLGWGGTFHGWASSGTQPAPNNMLFYIANQFRNAGIPQTWPLAALSDIISDYFWRTIGPGGINDYTTRYETTGFAPFPWGQTYSEWYWLMHGDKFGSYTGDLSATTPYWQGESGGYVYDPQTVPHVTQTAISRNSYQLGGVKSTVTTISGSILTISSSDGIPINGATGDVNASPYLKVTVAGNSDSTMNGGWWATKTSTTTYKLWNGLTGCSSSGALGTLVFRGVSYPILSYAPWAVTGSLPANSSPGEDVTLTGGGAACAQGVHYAFSSWCSYSPITFSCMNLRPYANSAGGTGGTVIVNHDQGSYDPLEDYQGIANARKESATAQTLYAQGMGWAGIRAYTGATVGVWLATNGTNSTLFPNGTFQIQTPPIPNTNTPLDFQQAWWALSPGLNYSKRLAPLYLQNFGPSPWIAPGPPYVVSTTETGSNGNVLTVWNTQEVPQTVSIPLGTFCQIGTNSISVYEYDYPHSTTALLTGAQTNYSLAMNPGEIDVFNCAPGGTTYVNPTVVNFTAPGGTSTTAMKCAYGNYNGPLTSYTKAAGTTSSSSSITLNLDPSTSSIWCTPTFLDGSDNVVSVGSNIQIPFVPPGSAVGTNVIVSGQVTISGQAVLPK